MLCKWFGAENTAPDTAAARFHHLVPIFSDSWSATENQRQNVIGEDITITGLHFNLGTAPGAGKTVSAKARIKGVGTTKTISAKAAVEKTTTRTVQSKARIKKIFTYTISAKASIRKTTIVKPKRMLTNLVK